MAKAMGLLGLAGLAHGIALAAPQPTTAEDDAARALGGWTPMPTSGPLRARDLFERDIAGTRTCGWFTEDFATREITCAIGKCMLYTPSGIVGMAGCCTSSAGVLDYQNCGWVNKCIDYSDYKAGKCDSACMSNDFIRVCTKSATPYCQSWTYPGPAVRDYGCGTDIASTWVTVSSRYADVIDGTATAQIPFVPASATVTGWNGAQASGTKTSGTTTGSGTSADKATTATGTSLSSSSAPSNSVPVTAIVIGVVVGVVVLAAAAGIIAFFCIRSKRRAAQLSNGPSAAAGAAFAGQHGGAPLTQHQQSAAVPPPAPYSAPGGPQPYYEQQPIPQAHGAAAEYYAGRDQKTPAVASQQYAAAPISAPGTPVPPYSRPFAAPPPPQMSPQMGQPMAPQMAQPYGVAQPYGHAVPPPQNGAVEAPINQHNPRPGYAELG